VVRRYRTLSCSRLHSTSPARSRARRTFAVTTPGFAHPAYAHGDFRWIAKVNSPDVSPVGDCPRVSRQRSITSQRPLNCSGKAPLDSQLSGPKCPAQRFASALKVSGAPLRFAFRLRLAAILAPAVALQHLTYHSSALLLRQREYCFRTRGLKFSGSHPTKSV